MSRKSYPNVNAANQYARDVVRGKIVACQYVIDACQRHIDDIPKRKGVNSAIDLIKTWQNKLLNLFSYYPTQRGSGHLSECRLRSNRGNFLSFVVHLAGCKKVRNSGVSVKFILKSPVKMASRLSLRVSHCIVLHVITNLVPKFTQAQQPKSKRGKCSGTAKLMCKRTPLLTEAFGIEVNAKNMNRPEDGARFEPLIGDPGDGQSPHCAIVDEYHEHDTDSLYTTMLTGMGARRQPLMWAITTAGYNIEGLCYDKRREVIEMLNGTVPNDELFGVIYTVDDGDDWTDPNTLKKANPNMGVSVYSDFLISQQNRAKNNPRLASIFKTKHLNIWVSARSAYFNMLSWRECEDKTLTLEMFEGQSCVQALDLVQKIGYELTG